MTPTPHDTPKAPDQDFAAAVDRFERATADYTLSNDRYNPRDQTSHDRAHLIAARQALLARYEAMRVEVERLEKSARRLAASAREGATKVGVLDQRAASETCLTFAEAFERWADDARSTLHATETEGRS